MVGLQVAHPSLGQWCLMADISEWQRGMDLRAYAAAGLGALSMRASSGSRLDFQFDTFSPWARDLGLKRLYYAWVRLDISTEQQLAVIRQAHDRYGRPELGWMLDVEDTNGTLDRGLYAARLARLWEAIVALDGRDPIIYTSGWYWNPRIGEAIDMGRCPLIVADYPYQGEGGQLSKPLPERLADYATWAFGLRGVFYADRAVPRPSGWSGWDAWQFTSVATNVPGRIGDNLDLNLMSNTLLDLRLDSTPAPPVPRPQEATTMPIRIAATEAPDPKPQFVLMDDGTKRPLGGSNADQAFVAACEAAGAPLVLISQVLLNELPPYRPPDELAHGTDLAVRDEGSRTREAIAALAATPPPSPVVRFPAYLLRLEPEG